MTQFKVLKINERFVTQLAIFSNYFTKPNDFFESIFSIFVDSVLIIAIITSAGFVVNYSYDVQPVLAAAKIFVAASQCEGMFRGVKGKTKERNDLQYEIQRIVDEDEENHKVHNMYWECEQKCRNHTQRMSYFIIFHNSVFPIVLVFALVCISFGNYDTSAWFLPWAMVAPFDQPLLNWFTKYLVEFGSSIAYAMCMTTITSYFVSCCYYIYTMCDHFGLLINSVENDVERMQTEENPRQTMEIRTKLCNIVKFHIKIYEIFHLLRDISSVAIFALLPANVITMAISLYNVELSALNFELSVLLFDVSCILCALFWPAFLCYFASHATYRISSTGNIAYNSNWFEYPPKLRKYVVLIICHSQQTVYFTGIGLIRCTLEVFGNLCRTSGSYYMLFRAIERR